MNFAENLLVCFMCDLGILIPPAFLCLFTVQERLKKGLLRAMLISFISFIPFSFVDMFLSEYFGVNQNITALSYAIAGFLYMCHATDVSPFKLFFILLVVINYMFYATPVAMLITRVIYYPVVDPAFYIWPDIWFVLLVLAVTLPPVAYVMKKKMWPSMQGIGPGEWKMLWLPPLTFTLSSVIIFYITGENTLANWTYAAALSLLTVCAFACYMVILRLLQRAGENARGEERMRQMDGQLKIQSERFREITAHVDEMRLLRHDMRHHMMTLTDMLTNNEIDKAKEYLSQYANDNKEAGELSLCQNYVVDVIVRRYAAIAKEQDIEVSLALSLPQESGIADTDLCIVLGNLMENALQATKKQATGERFMRVAIRTEESKVLIAVDNSAEQEKSQEGLGISSVKVIAAKYGGMTRFEQKEGIFEASVLLYRAER